MKSTFARPNIYLFCQIGWLLSQTGDLLFKDYAVFFDLMGNILEILPDLIECFIYSRGLFYFSQQTGKRAAR